MRKDELTVELPGIPRPRGRPPTGKAKDAATRQAEYRARKRGAGKVESTITLSDEVLSVLKAYVARQNADKADAHMSIGDAVDRIVRDRLMRKR